MNLIGTSTQARALLPIVLILVTLLASVPAMPVAPAAADSPVDSLIDQIQKGLPALPAIPSNPLVLVPMPSRTGEQVSPVAPPLPLVSLPSGHGIGPSMGLFRTVRDALLSSFDFLRASLAQAAEVCSSPTIGLKLLVIVAEPTDSNTALPAIKQVMDYQGTPYTVFIASPRPSAATPDRLASMLSSGCQGFYQGVILGNGQVAYNDPTAGWQSALTNAEWQTLWNYESAFKVRQVTWYTYPTPDYGFNWPTSSGSSPVSAQFTAPGLTNFSYVNTANPLTIQDVWIYRATPLDNNTTPLLLDSNGNALGAVRTYPNGTQNLALTFDSNYVVTHNLVLAYGLVNWVTNGLFMGERHIFLGAQVDDIFIDSHMWAEGTPCGNNTELNKFVFRMTGDDLQAVINWQGSMQAQPTTQTFRLDMVFVGEGTTAIYNPDTLTPKAKANQALFQWVNHTYTHDNLDNATYDKAKSEITMNNQIAQQLGLTTYSILNVVTPDVSGLANSEVMRAFYDAGVRYLVSDTSRPGYNNPSPNIGIYNQYQPRILMIPRRPTNLFYNVTNPQQWTEEYNCLYRSFWGRDLTYQEILDKESNVLLYYVLNGEMDPLMFHETNLRAYDGTRTLLGDLLDRTFNKYNGLFALPVVGPTMDNLGKRMADRMAYSSAGVTASVAPGRSITISAQRDAIVPVTGLNTTGAENYGGQDISHISLRAGETVTISLGQGNSSPIAANDSYAANEDNTLTVAAPGVLGNDRDADGDSLTAVLAESPANGTLILNANGSFTYTPKANFNGAVSFTYQAKDPSGAQSNLAMVTITVAAVNDAPVAANDSYTTSQTETLNVPSSGVLGNDTDVEGNTLTAILVTTTSKGTLTLKADGSFTYQPALSPSDYTDSFTYKANDGLANSNVATVTITVKAVNSAPVAQNDSYATNMNTTLNVAAPGVLGNDTDIDGNPVTAVLVSSTTKGTLTLNANGSFIYTPNANFTGTDSFTYKANDGLADSNVATVTITVKAVNSAPVAQNDSYATNEDTALNVPAPGVLANDADAESNPLTAVLVTGPAHGTLTLNADGAFSYAPVANFNGTDSFTYKAKDPSGAQSNVATVAITVIPVNDAPVAANDSYSTPQGVTLTVPAPGVLGNDTDVDGDPLTALLVTGTVKGKLTLNSNGSFSYQPDAGFAGTDLFTYRALDSKGASSNNASVTIAVNAVNNDPMASNDSYATNKDTSLNVGAPGVLGNDSDPDGDPLTAELVTGSANGMLILNANGSFSYQPNAGFAGTDPFTYRARDTKGAASNVATAIITVKAVNTPPVAANDAYSTNEDTPLSVPAPGVLGNDSDADGDSLTAVLITGSLNGVVVLNANGSFSYTPNRNFGGSDSFTYQARDAGGALSNAATVNITVTPVNDPPVAANDAYTTNEDIPLIVPAPGVLGNDSDADGDSLTAVLVAGPARGALALNANGSFTYTPNANFNGADSFSYQAKDPSGSTSNVATVAITVTPVNDTPVAANDAYSTKEDTPLSAPAPGVLGNDSDADGDSLTAVLITGSLNGVVVLNANGSFSYTPSRNFSGSDSFTYQARDAGGALSNAATVNITVTPVNDPPVAANDSYTTNRAANLLVVPAPGVLGNDSDADGDPLTAILVSAPTSGVLVLNGNGSFTYTPAPSLIGFTDSFTYKVSDGKAESNVAIVTIRVN